MFGLNEIVAVNNIPQAKKKFMQSGLNASINLGYGVKTYPPAGVVEKKLKLDKENKVKIHKTRS